MQSVPTYMFYGENARKDPDFWVHCETIQSRSSRHVWEIRLHLHESFFQILYLESGSGDAVFDDRIVPQVTRLDIGQADGACVVQTLTRLADEFDNRRPGAFLIHFLTSFALAPC